MSIHASTRSHRRSFSDPFPFTNKELLAQEKATIVYSASFYKSELTKENIRNKELRGIINGLEKHSTQQSKRLQTIEKSVSAILRSIPSSVQVYNPSLLISCELSVRELVYHLQFANNLLANVYGINLREAYAAHRQQPITNPPLTKESKVLQRRKSSEDSQYEELQLSRTLHNRNTSQFSNGSLRRSHSIRSNLGDYESGGIDEKDNDEMPQ